MSHSDSYTRLRASLLLPVAFGRRVHAVRGFASVACVGLVGIVLAGCGAGGSSTTATTHQARHTVTSKALQKCGRHNVWVAGISCGDLPRDSMNRVEFDETEIVGTQPLRVIEKSLVTQVHQTSDGWTCTAQLTGRKVYTTCWRGSQIVRFVHPAW
jgi:hypothetical protein